jgi:hypothetical protein
MLLSQLGLPTSGQEPTRTLNCKGNPNCNSDTNPNCTTRYRTRTFATVIATFLYGEANFSPILENRLAFDLGVRPGGKLLGLTATAKARQNASNRF